MSSLYDKKLSSKITFCRDAETQEERIERIKTSIEFDDLLAKAITYRARKIKIISRGKDIKQFHSKTLSHIKKKVDPRIIEVILSKDEHEGHNDSIIGRVNKKEMILVQDNQLDSMIKCVVSGYYQIQGLPVHNRLVRKKVIGCKNAILSIINS